MCRGSLGKTLTVLSEYQPQNNIIHAKIAPPGVPKINVCCDLGSARHQFCVVLTRLDNERISKALDDNVADYIVMSAGIDLKTQK